MRAREIVVISGKGGTGKTIVTASFAVLAGEKIMADCDVDAADLHLLLHPAIRERHVFRSGSSARIDPARCRACGTCIAVCRFGAIRSDYAVDPVACEGCGLCARVCPAQAIAMEENETGEWFLSDTAYGPLVHARLGIGEENSGKLVSLVKQKARECAAARGAGLIIVDGPPGIGCPVIASLAGAALALVVTEPTLSGLHDASRAVEVAAHFKVPARLVINKCDVNTDVAARIRAYGASAGAPVVGEIPFDRSVPSSIVKGVPPVIGAGDVVRAAIRAIWEAVAS